MPTTQSRVRFLALAGAVAVFAFVYYPVFVDLVGVWMGDANYSHGLLVLPIIAYLVWARRAQLAAEPLAPSNLGLVLIVGSLLVLLIGTAGVEFFLMRLSAVGVIVGAVLFVAGFQWLRLLMFPIGLLALVIPIPPVLFYQMAFPLQLLATKFGVFAIELFRIPVLREGNVITLTHTTLEVTEACSGIRSLVSLFALAVLYGYFTDSRPVPRVLITLSSVPIAIFANAFRIAGTGIGAHYFGPAVAAGFFHSFSGWAVFMASLVMLMCVAGAMKFLSFPVRMRKPEPEFAS